MKIEYGEITTKKIVKNVWIATTFTTSPMKSEVNMQGTTEEEAKRKLVEFLKDENV